MVGHPFWMPGLVRTIRRSERVSPQVSSLCMGSRSARGLSQVSAWRSASRLGQHRELPGVGLRPRWRRKVNGADGVPVPETFGSVLDDEADCADLYLALGSCGPRAAMIGPAGLAAVL